MFGKIQVINTSTAEMKYSLNTCQTQINCVPNLGQNIQVDKAGTKLTARESHTTSYILR